MVGVVVVVGAAVVVGASVVVVVSVAVGVWGADVSEDGLPSHATTPRVRRINAAIVREMAHLLRFHIQYDRRRQESPEGITPRVWDSPAEQVGALTQRQTL